MKLMAIGDYYEDEKLLSKNEIYIALSEITCNHVKVKTDSGEEHFINSSLFIQIGK